AATTGATEASAATTCGIVTTGAPSTVPVGLASTFSGAMAIGCEADTTVAATRAASTAGVARAVCGTGEGLSALCNAAASDASAGDAGPVRLSVHAPVASTRAPSTPNATTTRRELRAFAYSAIRGSRSGPSAAVAAVAGSRSLGATDAAGGDDAATASTSSSHSASA